MSSLTSRKPDPAVTVRIDDERRVLQAALLVRDAAAVHRVVDHDCTAGLHAGAVERLKEAAEQMEVEE